MKIQLYGIIFLGFGFLKNYSQTIKEKIVNKFTKSLSLKDKDIDFKIKDLPVLEKNLIIIIFPGTSQVKQALSNPKEVIARLKGIYTEKLNKLELEKYNPSTARRYFNLVKENLHTLKPGLNQIHNNSKDDNALQLMADMIKKTINVGEKKIIFLSFTWNGLLDEQSRYIESIKAYNEIKKYIKELKNENLNEEYETVLLGYSHGGNVALQMAKSFQYDQSPNFRVNKMILLGVPLYKKSQESMNIKNIHLKELFFEKVINFYSEGDLVSKYDFTTRSLFKSTPINNLAINIGIKYKNQKLLTHDDFGKFTERINKVPFMIYAYACVKELEKHYYFSIFSDFKLNFIPFYEDEFLTMINNYFYRNSKKVK